MSPIWWEDATLCFAGLCLLDPEGGALWQLVTLDTIDTGLVTPDCLPLLSLVSDTAAEQFCRILQLSSLSADTIFMRRINCKLDASHQRQNILSSGYIMFLNTEIDLTICWLTWNWSLLCRDQASGLTRASPLNWRPVSPATLALGTSRGHLNSTMRLLVVINN